MTTTQTTPLTEQQAHVLNSLADTCSDLRKKIVDVIRSAEDQLERATKGYHLAGFDGDLFGQARYNADALAVQRKCEIRLAHSVGCPHEAITVATTPDANAKGYRDTHWFSAGDTFDVVEDES
jgi:hypothetical protein